MNILWIPHTGWHIPQRAHIFCNALAERHKIHVTDWVADFSTPRDYFSRRYLRNLRYRHHRDGLIYVHGIPRFSPAIYSRLLRQLNTILFRYFVAWIIEQQHIDVVVGTFLVPPPKAHRLVFDLFDENVASWRASQAPAYANEIERIEHAYLQTADAVVVASSVLADKARTIGTRGPVYLIPNGVDLKRFEHANGNNIRQEMGLQGTVIGMIGNYDRPDELEKVLDAAKLLGTSDLSFLIVGRGLAVPDSMKRAEQENLQNVHFYGYVEPNQIPDVLAAIDVGLCPYPKTPMDDARSPLRLFDYIGAGLPVVCTDLLEVRRLQFPSVILVEDSAPALADGIQRARRLPRLRPSRIESYDTKRLAKQYEAVLSGDLTKCNPLLSPVSS